MITKKDLKKAWETTKIGYGKGVGFVQENAPKLERRFGRMAQTTTEAFKPIQMDVKPEFRVPKSRIDFGTPRRMRRSGHDFGKLSFNI